MIINKFLICAIICISSLSFAGISDVGSGGDIVACVNRDLEKLYSLDFVVARSEFSENIIPTSSIQKSLDRIRQLLTQKAPGLTGSFNEFTSHLKNSNSKLSHVWIPSHEPLTDIDDEEIFRLPHISCAPNNYSTVKTELRQAIIRTVNSMESKNGLQITYHYDADIYLQLERRFPLQLSFLLVHEWLWSLNTQVDENRNINYFLHSDKFEKLSAKEVKSYLTALGLPISK